MKKVLLFVGIGAVAYVLLSGKDADASGGGAIASGSPVAEFEGEIIYDSRGIWMYVKNGVMYSLPSYDWLQNFWATHPGKGAIEVKEDLWSAYNGTPYVSVNPLPATA